MTADTIMVMAHCKCATLRFEDVGATPPQRVIDPTPHHIRRNLIFNELIKDKVMIPVNKCREYLKESREVLPEHPLLHWATVLSLLLFLSSMMYLLLEWG